MHTSSAVLGPRISSEPWDILDRFLGQLQQLPDVFLCSGTSGEVTDWCGPIPPEPGAWGRLAAQILASASAEGQVLRSQLTEGEDLLPRPASAALVRLSRSRQAWVVAIRCDPRSPLGLRDLRPMILARRLLLAQQQQARAQDQISALLFGLVRCLTASLDARDAYTWGHSERVARIGVRLATEMKLPGDVRSDLYLGGLLHDVGKIGVPDHILRKPGRLTDEEMAQVQQHVTIGDSILAHVPQLSHIRPSVRSHHERYDGKGYPDGLAGEEIPLLPRVLAVADTCDAMLSERPYRKALDPARVAEILREGAGSQWDPEVVRAFLACRADVYAIGQRGLGESVLQAVEQALASGSEVADMARTFLPSRMMAQE
jgi:HD-GYP domain-containing protein (c-di-GMP phosphodiesterase class II)